jgi:hypothetical protein
MIFIKIRNLLDNHAGDGYVHFAVGKIDLDRTEMTSPRLYKRK